MRSLIFSLLIGAVMAAKGAAAEEEFREELTLHPLPDGKVAAHFSFSTLLRGAVPRAPSSLGTDDICTRISLLRGASPGLTDRGGTAFVPCRCLFPAQHYSIFPLALGQILREHAIPEFHLTLNSGKWDYDRWGHPGEPGVGSGAELWAWMGDGAQREAK
jgi:GPI-anchor transamidase subunit T